MTKTMKNLLNLEELAQFLLSIMLFSRMEYAWWIFPALLLVPDLSMLGYLANPRIGAIIYNIFHHKLLGIGLFIIGIWFSLSALALAGVILFGHAAMDRIFGYGLKYNDNFHHTHLGWIGKK